MILEKLKQNTNYFIRYSIIGFLGTIIDLGFLYIFVEIFHIPILISASISFLLAVTNNFIFNKKWTFKNQSKNYRKLYIKYLLVSLVGLILTIILMYIFVYIFKIWYIFAQIITMAIIAIWNFLINKIWTFAQKIKLLTSGKNDIFLSIIIPAYNEEKRIKQTLIKIEKYLKNKKWNTEVIVINDGSTDHTQHIVQKLQKKIPYLHLINLGKNFGKGFAVKKGIEQANGKYILFTDADNSTPIQELDKFIKKIKSKDVDIIIGSRFLKQSKIKKKQPIHRIIMSRTGNLLIRLFLLKDIKDTQCGFKLFKNKIAKEIFHYQKVKRFGFDIEILVIAKNLGYKVIEMPISWTNSTDTKVRPIKDSLHTLKDLLYIKLNLALGRYNRD